MEIRDILIFDVSERMIFSFGESNARRLSESLKIYLTNPPVLSKPALKLSIRLYFSVTDRAINSVIRTEEILKKLYISSIKSYKVKKFVTKPLKRPH